MKSESRKYAIRRCLSLIMTRVMTRVSGERVKHGRNHCACANGLESNYWALLVREEMWAVNRDQASESEQKPT